MLSSISLSVLLIAPSIVTAVWPLPKQFSTGTTPLQLSCSFQITLQGVKNAPQDLRDAVSRTSLYLENDKLQALVIDRGASSANVIKSAKILQSLTLSLFSNTTRSITAETLDDVESRMETYSLIVPADGSGATLKANSTLGLFRGLTTFEQLWYDWQGTTYTLQAPFDIVDAPAYVCASGLLLCRCLTILNSRIVDSCWILPGTSKLGIHNFLTCRLTFRSYPVADIKRTLDAMSWVKVRHPLSLTLKNRINLISQINTFHWHVVDSQSFPLVVPGFSEIATNGAYSSSQVYQPSDVKDIVTYAAAVRSSPPRDLLTPHEQPLTARDRRRCRNRHPRSHLHHRQIPPRAHRVLRIYTMGFLR